ncbi:hypothetical protein AQS8620_02738 [Aquimixticola soesokkakensis]|uniref:Hemerythrin-like domain-containing protein n=1 Tax=Aquimixticola soesokkakensis TaxID=1519096 RepID=A0A1Y5THQ5_9RHOB|nr:hemerythrin domain-containing protein [Aquimixticola soesokkakensis]SLN60610.1 hypothetical protein AQS8620_02738 [Aquimixticola soesokkakensis]
MMDHEFLLETRAQAQASLPDALRVLLADYPRLGWDSHPEFSGLVSFWLERHLGFRKLLAQLQRDAQERLDRDMSAQSYAHRLSHMGGSLVSGLHGHHQIEDHHYFPRLKALDGRLERGFDILERDHAAMDGMLARFSEAANLVLTTGQDADAREHTARFSQELATFGELLDRHLIDEEEIIVPVILNNGAAGLS